jgi:ribosomal protein L29
MFHPLQQDLSNLSDSEIESKLQELSRKYFAAQRMGSADLLTQVSTFVNIYRNELSRRYMTKNKGDLDRDLDQLINVD